MVLGNFFSENSATKFSLILCVTNDFSLLEIIVFAFKYIVKFKVDRFGFVVAKLKKNQKSILI